MAAPSDTQVPRRPERSVPRGRLLLVDDDDLLLRAIQRILRGDEHEIATADGWEAMQPHLESEDLDLVLLDLRLSGERGEELLSRLKHERPDVEVIVMTGHASVSSAVDCMRLGAFDYLEKPFEDVVRVRTTVQRAIEHRRLVTRNRELEDELSGRDELPEWIGQSQVMRALMRTARSLRHNESHVLIQGESGTGKEVLARIVHGLSPRRGSPFVPVDCGALPETIIESELFGHERGAFTGALGAPGLFRVADGGTLFLDEIGEIPNSIQSKLLRALQNKEVRPLGARAAVPVDIRIVCATHRDLSAMVEDGSFRRDLYYRLNVVRIEVPPLRERREDVPLLARHFLAKHLREGSRVRSLEPDALETLVRYDWPGNVRELENAIESGLALAHGDRLCKSDLSLGGPIRGEGGVGAASADAPAGLPLSLSAYERCVLERALRESEGDATEAARRLGIGRSTIYRKLQRHGIEPLRRARSHSEGPEGPEASSEPAGQAPRAVGSVEYIR
ncbi:MAG: sigma-54 dependent transcriptional regulator [Myxococcota bacterium]|nr:sigma-54 dependent transcriptional regulator [Myxococcota bacterium]